MRMEESIIKTLDQGNEGIEFCSGFYGLLNKLWSSSWLADEVEVPAIFFVMLMNIKEM